MTLSCECSTATIVLSNVNAVQLHNVIYDNNQNKTNRSLPFLSVYLYVYIYILFIFQIAIL